VQRRPKAVTIRAVAAILDEPVEIPGIGIVGDDVWEGRYLKTIR
jgi:hypothetical protein